MALSRKAGVKGAKSPRKTDLVDMAAASQAAVVSVVDEKPASEPAPAAALSAPVAMPLPSVRDQGDVFRQAMSEAVTVSARGAFDVNDKIIEALHAQSHAALAIWRTAITAPHLPEAFQTQTQATRQAYEAASAQWKDIAATTARWVAQSLEPLQSVLHRQSR